MIILKLNNFPCQDTLDRDFFIGGEVMKNYKFGYARVSTEEQVLDRQIDMLSEYGVNQIYSEKMTGTKRNRPELEKMLDRLSEGDTVVIESCTQ